MSETVIKIENLSKCFILEEQLGKYNAKEDLIKIFKKTVKNNPKPSQDLGNDFWALNDINLEIKKGEVVGIIGRNGAGKSTLLKTIARIVHPTKGRIEIKGKISSLLEVGTGFHPDLTGQENIFLNGAFLGLSKKQIKERYDEIIDFASIDRFINIPVKRYSSGMKARLGFSVAAHLEADILLIDEVLAVGDRSFYNRCIRKMEEIRNHKDRTVIFVSHNLSAITTSCSKALILDAGKIIKDGPVKEIVTEYVENSTENKLPTINLAEIEDRSGPRNYYELKRLSVVDQSNTARNVFGMFESFQFHLELKSFNKDAVACIEFSISSAIGIKICRLSSEWEEFEKIKGNNYFKVRAHIKEIPLFEGEYFISVGIKPHGESVFDDFVKNVTTLRIAHNSDNKKNVLNFGSDVSPGEVYLKSDWEIL